MKKCATAQVRDYQGHWPAEAAMTVGLFSSAA